MNTSENLADLPDFDGSRPPGQPPTENSFDILTITFLCISGVALLANLVMVYTVARPANKKIRTAYMILLANLAICDSFNILVNVFSPMKAIISNISEPWLCGFILASRLVVKKLTSMGLLLVCLDKFVAIRFPFYYEDKSNINKAITASVVAAVLSILYGTVPVTVMLDKSWYPQIGCVTPLLLPIRTMMYLTVVGNYTVEFVLIAGVYIYIASVVIRLVRRTSSSDATGRREYLRGSLKCMLIIVVHIVCQWPACINTVVEYITGNLTPITTVIYLHKLSELNSWINPIIYVFTQKSLRDAIGRLLRCS